MDTVRSCSSLPAFRLHHKHQYFVSGCTGANHPTNSNKANMYPYLAPTATHRSKTNVMRHLRVRLIPVPAQNKHLHENPSRGDQPQGQVLPRRQVGRKTPEGQRPHRPVSRQGLMHSRPHLVTKVHPGRWTPPALKTTAA